VPKAVGHELDLADRAADLGVRDAEPIREVLARAAVPQHHGDPQRKVHLVLEVAAQRAPQALEERMRRLVVKARAAGRAAVLRCRLQR
jgi:hypothetical protein